MFIRVTTTNDLVVTACMVRNYRPYKSWFTG
jgi:hypothetical protein